MSDSEKTKSSWWEIIMNFCVTIDRKCKPTERYFDQCAILKILGHAGRPTAFVTIIAGMAFYMIGCPQRQMQAENQRRATHYQAWQIIKSGMGQRSSGGRVVALQDLNKDKVSLAGVDISNAYLLDLNLKNANLTEADLTDANFPRADLTDANLTKAILSQTGLAGANLSHANLTKARLTLANLAGADLSDANLTGAYIANADLTEAELTDANLTGAILSQADLTGADLTDADLTGAFIYKTNLTEADLTDANFKDMKGNWNSIESIKNANLHGAKDPPKGFIEWATSPEQGAVRIEDEGEWRKMIREKRQEKTIKK